MESRIKTYLTAGSMITSLGFTTEENIDAIRRHESGIDICNDKKLNPEPFTAGQIDRNRLKELVEKEGIQDYTTLEQLFILCLLDVIRKSGVEPAECGLILSTTKGNIDYLTEFSDDVYISSLGKRVASYLNIDQNPILISTACISGVTAIIAASRLIHSGKYKHILIAGGDLLTQFVVSGFQSFKSISPSACCPYDKDRDGLTLGEACGAILMTSDKKYLSGNCPVEVVGGSVSNDANHISGPSRTGDGLYYAIAGAMKEAGVHPDNISFVNTHGTGTPYNDEMESKALHLSQLDDKPVNSLKPYWGHTLGAAGVIETIACVEQLQQNEVYGTPGYTENGVSYPLQVNAIIRKQENIRCVKTASGFGGCNAALVLAKESHTLKIPHIKETEYRKVKTCFIRNNQIIVDGRVIFDTDHHDNFSVFIRRAYKHLNLEDRKFYKMDDLSKLMYIAAAYLLDGFNRTVFEPVETGIILCNSSASLDTDKKHQSLIQEEDTEASPAVFVYTLPNVGMGELCIRHKIQGDNTFFITEQYDKEFIRDYTRLAMQSQDLKACICGYCDFLEDDYEAQLEWWEIVY